MARKTSKKAKTDPWARRTWGVAKRFLWRWLRRILAIAAAVFALILVAYAFVNPPTTLFMASEAGRLGGVKHDWVALEDMAPVMARSVVAAEDANFCLHWGFDMSAIRQVIAEGETRGASTLSQQVVKNVFLWPARSWLRKSLEALMTPPMELVWTKRRVIEVYLNVAEFDEGVFGVGAAARHYFGKTPAQLTAREAALLASILPNPKGRSASRPGQFTQRRAVQVADGAATILLDGRAACFED